MAYTGYEKMNVSIFKYVEFLITISPKITLFDEFEFEQFSSQSHLKAVETLSAPRFLQTLTFYYNA